MNNLKNLFLMACVATFLAGCETDKPDTAGERLDKAAEETRDAIEDAGEEVSDGVEDATD